jgi:oligopeptide transport system substrate-binding protein
MTPDMDVVPEVARSWEVLDEGYKYVFHLRDDVYWSDDTPLTAADFVYAWQRVLTLDKSSTMARYLFDIKGSKALAQGELTDPTQLGVYAPDRQTLVVELEWPTSYFPQLLALPVFSPVPRHVVEKYGLAWTDPAHLVSYGPFLLGEWQPGHSLTLTRNPRYQGQFMGNVQHISVLFDLLPPETLALYEANQLDLIHVDMFLQRELMQQRYATEYFSNPSLHIQYIGFNTTLTPFDDKRVRQAFALALDKETLVSLVLEGYRFPADGGFIPAGMPGHSPGIGLPYDPERARQLLAAAGYPDGKNFPAIECLLKPYHKPEYEYLREQWRRVLGVEITWQAMAWDKLLNRLNHTPPHLFMIGWSPDFPDPDNLLRVGALFGDKLRWHNDTYLALVEEARQLANQAERMRLDQQADKILVEEAAIIPLYYHQAHSLVKSWISRFPTSPLSLVFWKDVVIEPH